MAVLRVAIAMTLPLILLFTCVAQPGSSYPNARVTYTQIDFPGAFSTTVSGINSAGEIVGVYQLSLGGNSHGFTLASGTFASFDAPGGELTEVNGISDLGLVVGTVVTNIAESKAQGFVYDGTSFSVFSYPGAPYTEGNSVNNNGEIAGRAGALGVKLFAYTDNGGQFAELTPPGNLPSVGAFGINDLGDVVGYRASLSMSDGFLLKNGTFSFFDRDGGLIFGLNNSDDIVGTYYVNYAPVGFVSINGRRFSLAFPGAAGTAAIGISNKGQVAGVFTDASGTEHGFVTSPVTTEYP